MLYGSESGLQRRFEHHGTYEMFQELKLVFQARAHVRGTRPPTIILACKLREKISIVELVLRLSKYNNHLNRVGVDLPDEILMFLRSHYHQAARAS